MEGAITMTDISKIHEALFSFPRIPPLKIPIIDNPNMANVFYDRLRHHIEDTQNKLEENQQLAIYYYAPGGEPILVTDIGYHNPNLIILYGMDSKGNESNILLHMQSVQLVLKIIGTENKTNQKIGFLSE
jgi:hypothetical protein